MWDSATDNLECGVVSYKVILSRNGFEERYNTTMDLYHTFTELNIGTSYSVIVVSINDAGNATSTEFSATTFGEILMIVHSFIFRLLCACTLCSVVWLVMY